MADHDQRRAEQIQADLGDLHRLGHAATATYPVWWACGLPVLLDLEQGLRRVEGVLARLAQGGR